MVLSVHRQTASVCLLASLLLLLETKAGAAAQLPLLLGKVISPRGAGPGLQDIVHLQHYFIDSSSIRLKVERLVVMVAEISELKYCMTGASFLYKVTGTKMV